VVRKLSWWNQWFLLWGVRKASYILEI